MRKKRTALCFSVLVGGSFALPAQAGEFPVTVACPDWGAEAAAQVEARIRATLRADALDPLEVAVSCTGGEAVSVKVVVSHEVTREVARRSQRIEDDVVWSVEAALVELAAAKPSEPPPAAVSSSLPAPAPAAAPAPPPVAAPSPRRTRPEPPRPRPTRLSQLALTGVVERWRSFWVGGGEASLGIGDETLQYGLALAARNVAGEPSGFQLQELSACARLALTPVRTAGFSAQLGIGLSALLTTPSNGVVSQSATSLSTAFLELQLSRPFWFGAFAVAPSLGARVFSAPRKVRVDGNELLILPRLAPQASLSLIYRLL